MGYSDTLNLEKTLSERKLYFKSHWVEQAGNIVYYTKAVLFIDCILLMIRDTPVRNGNDKIIIFYLLPISLLFALWMIYKKWRERRLVTVPSPIDTKEKRKALVEHAKQNDWELLYNNQRFLMARTGLDIAGWCYLITVIYTPTQVLISVLRDNPTIRIPVFLRQNGFKYEIEKLLAGHLVGSATTVTA